MKSDPFAIMRRFRPFAVVSPGFERAVAGPGPTGQYVTDSSPVAPFAAVELELAEVGVGGAAAGLLTAGGDGVQVTYEPARAALSVTVTTDGRPTVVRRRRLRGGVPQRVAFVVCENRVTGLADVGAGWVPVVSERDRVAALVDLRVPTTLARHNFAWGPAQPERGDLVLRGARCGTWGMTGVRDPHLVQLADGTPYVIDGAVYLTMTCAGPGFFPAAHWGVFTLDLAAPERLTQVGHLFSRRDGLLLGDHAGQVVVDPDAGRCWIATSSWGDFTPEVGVHVRQTSADLDVLHGEHVLDTVPLSLPTPHSAWDPAATVIDGRWHVAFVESPSQQPFSFRPALAVGPIGGSCGEDLALVGSDTSLDQCEGPMLTRLDGAWRLLASDGRARRYPAYDLGMQRVGELTAPYLSNIPHPQVVPLPAGSALGRELLVTFDGTAWGERVLGYGTHGDVVVMSR